MSKIANWLFGLSQNIARKRGSKLKIELDEQDINVKYESKKDTENSVWENYYPQAGIFYKDHPPEIKLDPDSIRDGKVDTVSTAEIAPILQTRIFSKMWMFGESNQIQEQKINAMLVLLGVGIVLMLVM